MRNRSRNLAIWTTAVAMVAVAVAVVWTLVGINRRATVLLDRGPSVPAPSADDAAAVPLTRDPVRITVRQRGSAWLPGGAFKLHIDDITGAQVMVSVTDRDGRVVHGPKSVRARDTFTVGEVRVTVIRLENLLVGSDDFAEFDVALAPPATTRTVP